MSSRPSSFGEKEEHQCRHVLVASVNSVVILALLTYYQPRLGYSSSSPSLSFVPFPSVGCWSRPHFIYVAFKVR